MKFGRQLTDQEIDFLTSPEDHVSEGSEWVDIYVIPGIGKVATGGDYGGAWGDCFVVPDSASAKEVLDQVRKDW